MQKTREPDEQLNRGGLQKRMSSVTLAVLYLNKKTSEDFSTNTENKHTKEAAKAAQDILKDTVK